MRLRLCFLAFCLFLGACTIRTTSIDSSPGEGDTSSGPSVEPGTSPAPAPNPRAAEPTVPQGGVLPEVVYLFMWDKSNLGWMCTATLVARDTVVTAAHCLDETDFVRYLVVAPNAPGKPRVTASSPRVFGGAYSDVANPDLGFLTLSRWIDLPPYAD